MKKIHRLNFALEEEQYEKLREIAYKTRRSIADILREIIDKYLDKNSRD